MPTGLAVAIPEGFAGFVQPRSGLAARHGIAVVNSPGLIDSGYRGEIRVVLLNTDREHAFVAEPGERIAQLVVLPGARARAGRAGRAARERARRAGLRLLPHLTWSRASACPRSCGARAASSSSATRRGGASTGSSRAAASAAGETLLDAVKRELAEEVGIDEDLPLEGPVALADSISPPGWPPKHVVHIVFAGYLGDRSLERVTSRRRAVRNHRLFDVDELAGLALHPPIQRFLSRWQPGDPTVYLGSLWAP